MPCFLNISCVVSLSWQVCLAYKTLTNNDLPSDAVISHDENSTFTFEDFCRLVSEHRYQSHVSETRIYASIDIGEASNIV